MDIRDAEPLSNPNAPFHGQGECSGRRMDAGPPGRGNPVDLSTLPNAANAITVPGKVVGVAIATGRVVRGIASEEQDDGAGHRA